MNTNEKSMYNVTAVKGKYVASQSFQTASSEHEAIELAKMNAIPGNVKGATWRAEFVREAS